MQSAADQALQAGRQLVETPPEALIRLVRMVVRAFYTPEHAVIIDCLVKRTIVKEDDMTGMFRLDLKQLRQLLVALKQDKLISSRKGMETTADGRVSKYEYFYINYEVFVNVVKYKLDSMQHRLEREQREFTARAAFHCTGCGKTFTDLEVNQLMDFATGELKCTFCSAEVVEEENMATRQDLRTTVAKFHEQVRDPLDALLKELERFRLGSSLTEPPLTDAHLLASGDRPDGTGSVMAAGGGPSNPNSGATITVDMAGSNGGGKLGPGVKQAPQWMLDSALAPDDDSNSRFSLDGGGVGGAAGAASGPPKPGLRKDEIHELLIQHEVRQRKHPQAATAAASNSATPVAIKAAGKSSKKRGHHGSKHKKHKKDPDDDDGLDEEARRASSASPTPSDSDDSAPAKRIRGAPTFPATEASDNADSDDSNEVVEDTDDSEDEEEDDGNEDEGDDELAVTFRGARVPYDEVTEEMVQQMTPAEKQEYAAVGQKFYAQFAD